MFSLCPFVIFMKIQAIICVQLQPSFDIEIFTYFKEICRRLLLLTKYLFSFLYKMFTKSDQNIYTCMYSVCNCIGAVGNGQTYHHCLEDKLVKLVDKRR